MKKNKILQIILLILLITSPLVGQELFVSFNGEEDTVDISLSIPKEELNLLFNSMDQGFRSQLIVKMSLYQKGKKSFFLLGEKKVQEIFFSYIIGHDQIYPHFTLESPEEILEFNTQEELLVSLSSLLTISLRQDLRLNNYTYFMDIEYSIIKVFLVPPFSLINYLFNLDNLLHKKVQVEVPL